MYSRLGVERKDGSSQDGEFGDGREVSPTSHFAILDNMTVSIWNVRVGHVAAWAGRNSIKQASTNPLLSTGLSCPH